MRMAPSERDALAFAASGRRRCLVSVILHNIISDLFMTGLGPLKEDVSRIGSDDDDRQAKGKNDV